MRHLFLSAASISLAVAFSAAAQAAPARAPDSILAIEEIVVTDKTIALLRFQNAGAPLANRYNAPRTVGANIIYRW